MKNFLIKNTLKTPFVNLNADSGLIEFKGRSIPEDARAYFEPIIDWLKDYADNPAFKTIVNFQFEYFNTSTSKWLISVFKLLCEMREADNEVEFNWFYDDDDLLEYAREMEDFFQIKMNTREVESCKMPI